MRVHMCTLFSISAAPFGSCSYRFSCSIFCSNAMGFTKMQKDEFAKLYKTACEADESTRLVKLKDDMLHLLIEGGEARVKYMHPKTLVPHPKNRGGSKMHWRKIFEKGAKIISVGVSLAQCGPDKAVAFEEHPVNRRFGKQHVELCKSSPHYALYTDADAVEAGTVGCGHWNQMLACIIDKRPVPSEFAYKLCEPGHPNLDGERLCRDQPALRGLLHRGLETTVIKHSIESEYPQLPSIFQKALNVEHHIGEGIYVDFCYCGDDNDNGNDDDVNANDNDNDNEEGDEDDCHF